MRVQIPSVIKNNPWQKGVAHIMFFYLALLPPRLSISAAAKRSSAATSAFKAVANSPFFPPSLATHSAIWDFTTLAGNCVSYQFNSKGAVGQIIVILG